jgi:hypothetical protein
MGARGGSNSWNLSPSTLIPLVWEVGPTGSPVKRQDRPLVECPRALGFPRPLPANRSAEEVHKNNVCGRAVAWPR